MKLTEAQIQELFLFTEKKYVKYYDLQVELVDHLAMLIEEEMSINNKLSFEQALEKVYTGFGIFGFAKVVQEKEEQFVRMGRRHMWKEFKNFFRWPEITFVALVATIVWQLTTRINMEILFPAFFVAWVIGSFLFVFDILRNIKKQKKKLLSIQFSPAAVNGPVTLFETFYFSTIENHNAWLFCIIVTLTFLLKLATYRAYNNIFKEAVRTYPEAFA
ncbi:MAG: hypothetical protein QM737_10650 [Ferruginibacter sp.]